MNNQSNTPTRAANPTVTVLKMVNDFVSKGTLHLPSDYSAENALKQAFLMLQEIKNRSNQPVLTACTQASICNALLDMVIQGLNPAKKHCYFIAYGEILTCQRSYFGDQMLAERIMPGIEIFSGVVYEKDTLEISIERGRRSVKHSTSLDNIDLDAITGAYCGILDENGNELGTEIMTWEQIQKSWGMSKTYKPGNTGGTHVDFPDQMALRTVIRRRCKPIINASNDALLMESIRRQDMDAVDYEADEAALSAHQEPLAADPPIIDAQFTDPSQNGKPEGELVGAGATGGDPGY